MNQVKVLIQMQWFIKNKLHLLLKQASPVLCSKINLGSCSDIFGELRLKASLECFQKYKAIFTVWCEMKEAKQTLP